MVSICTRQVFWTDLLHATVHNSRNDYVRCARTVRRGRRCVYVQLSRLNREHAFCCGCARTDLHLAIPVAAASTQFQMSVMAKIAGSCIEYFHQGSPAMHFERGALQFGGSIVLEWYGTVSRRTLGGRVRSPRCFGPRGSFIPD